MQDFEPHLEILPASQRKLWTELSSIPSEFVLYRGTALALHLGHRDSVDFDFFSNRALNLAALEAEIPFLKGARIIQREPEITLKALSYFDDGDLRALPEELKTRLVVAAREVDLEHLPVVERTALSRDLDQGHEL